MVRNGHHRPLTVTTAAGPIEVTAPAGTHFENGHLVERTETLAA